MASYKITIVCSVCHLTQLKSFIYFLIVASKNIFPRLMTCLLAFLVSWLVSQLLLYSDSAVQAS